MILDDMIKQKKEDIKKAQKEFPAEWLGRSLAYNPYTPRDFKSAINAKPHLPYRVIAEVKKASPDKGVICEDFDPLLIAKAYEEGGAAALSILTEKHFFLGHLDYLGFIKRFVKIPILRKDFIIDEYQIIESAVYGADSILLITSILSKQELKRLIDFSRRFGMEPLVEVRSKTELLKAIAAGADIIGINHQNLHDFSIDMTLSEQLTPLIPKGKIIVAENGIDSKEFLEKHDQIGVDAFLIGEYFLKKDERKEALATFITKK